MKAAGIVHTPGMAKKMLDQIAPLLKEDGFDLDDPNGVDLDRLNAALSQASERHNLELFTPVGVHRANALDLLRQFSNLLAQDRPEEAFELLDAIPPDPGRRTAAVAHVIGAGLGILDEWGADPEVRGALAVATAPKILGVPRGSTREILEVARESNAFDSTDMLIRHYAGKAVLEGTMLAVAAVIVAVAAMRGESEESASQRLLVAGGSRRAEPARASRSVFGGGSTNAPMLPPPVISFEARAALRDFGHWVQNQPDVPEVLLTDGVPILRNLFKAAAGDGIDVCDPGEVEFVVELISDALGEYDPESAEAASLTLLVFDAYIHFRLGTGQRTEEWSDAHEIVEDSLGIGPDDNPMAELLVGIMAAEEQLDPKDVRVTLAGTRIVSAVRGLLEFIGASLPVTSTGALRRADIRPVSALLGLDVVGVSKHPLHGINVEDPTFDREEWLRAHENGPVYALSMWDVPLLTGWWEALRVADLIEVKGTRVRPGSAAAQWCSEELPPSDHADMLVAAFLAQALSSELGYTSTYVGDRLDRALEAEVLHALGIDVPAQESEGEHAGHLTVGYVTARMSELAELGLFTRDPASGEIVAPPGLRAPIARGTMLAGAYRMLPGGEDDYDDDWGL